MELFIIAAILVAVWLLLLLAHIGGMAVHGLLVIAVAAVIIHFLRKPGEV